MRKNRKAHVAGVIRNGNGTPAASGTVKLVRGSRVLKSTKADEDGHFAFTFKVKRTFKNYKVKWVRSGSNATNLTTRARTIRCVR